MEPRFRQTKLDQFRAENEKGEKTEVNGIDGFLSLLLGGPPLVTQKRIALDPVSDREVRGYMGGFGSGKTSTLAATCLMRSILCPGRKSFVSRHDYNDLAKVTVADFETMLARLPSDVLLGRDKSPPMKWVLRPAFPGKESTITFMGLKDPIVGHNAHDWYIDQAEEVEEKRAKEIIGRLRAPGYNDRMLMMNWNPTDKNHWLYAGCTGKNGKDEHVCEPWIKLYQSLPRENEKNLPQNFYDSLRQVYDEDMLERYINGLWGSVFDGQPVYRQFKYNLHSTDVLEYVAEWPLQRWWDFGYRRPACLWVQPTPAGGFHVLHEELGNSEDIKSFARRCLRVGNQRFYSHTQPIRDFDVGEEVDYEITDYGDPAVRHKKDTGSTLASLLSCGIRIRYKTGQKVRDGLEAVRAQLRLLADDGEPAILIDRRNCPILINGFKGGYRLRDDGEEPFKDGFYEHIADAFRYGLVMNTTAGGEQGLGGSRIPDSLEYSRNTDTY